LTILLGIVVFAALGGYIKITRKLVVKLKMVPQSEYGVTMYVFDDDGEIVDFEKVFVGSCLGIGLSMRGDDDNHVCIDILVEDDDNWFIGASGFSSAWLPELTCLFREAEVWIHDNCIKTDEGYSFK
jgi:hypothetical protein